MTSKKIKTKTLGVRYREHPTRKHGVRRDKYYTIRYRLNGKVKEEALGWESQGWTENKAAARLCELKENQRTGVGARTLAEKCGLEEKKRQFDSKTQEQTRKESITFAEIFERYMEQAIQDKDHRTCLDEQSKFNKWLAPLFRDMPIKDISPFLLEKLKKQMSDAGKAPRTIAYALAVVRQVFNYAKSHDLYNGSNPTSKIRKPSEDNRRSRFLSHAKAELLLDELGMASPALHDMALLSLHCGLRAGEIFNLEWSDIDFQNETILIKDTKSKRNRHTPITADVKSILKRRSSQKQSDIVFPSRTGDKTTEVSRTFDRVIDKLGFNKGITDRRQKAVFHTLRHTYASWLVMSGVDLYTVQKLMGHSTIAMTERYSHLAPNHLRKAVGLLEESIKRNKKDAQSNVLELKDMCRRAKP